ncbi:hypothetical protein E4N90_01285 [Treponema denticola]|uniref:hypothetical protein n=1 Tax=Treponema denticola TaxID=158 RepID=UPI0020A5690E|nr:hypothetical protein [Treponema denticola]UTD06641.1 hypothetical protein E4N90_01285 [Treponema denticola]
MKISFRHDKALAARLRGCEAARLRGCEAARLRGCEAARLRGCEFCPIRCFMSSTFAKLFTLFL